MKNKRIIKKNHEFQKIINKHKSLKNTSFVIHYRKNEKGFFKFGISVGKKIGNAVIRNKIKRQIRSMIQNLIKDKVDCSFDIIVIARKNFLQKTYEDCYKDLKKLFKKFNLQ